MIAALVERARARIGRWRLPSDRIGTTSAARLPEVTFGP